MNTEQITDLVDAAYGAFPDAAKPTKATYLAFRTVIGELSYSVASSALNEYLKTDATRPPTAGKLRTLIDARAPREASSASSSWFQDLVNQNEEAGLVIATSTLPDNPAYFGWSFKHKTACAPTGNYIRINGVRVREYKIK